MTTKSAVRVVPMDGDVERSEAKPMDEWAMLDVMLMSHEYTIVPYHDRIDGERGIFVSRLGQKAQRYTGGPCVKLSATRGSTSRNEAASTNDRVDALHQRVPIKHPAFTAGRW
jgi:hypothetical protein